MDDPYRIAYMEAMVERWQSLYPYAVFLSPEILKKKVLCSICDAVVKPRSSCVHRKGEIYDGEMCNHMVVELEFLGLSIVDNPVQRYSVAFTTDAEGNKVDQFKYEYLRFVVDRFSSPWHPWTSQMTTREVPAGELLNFPTDADCPCGSGSAFASCCTGKASVLVPHRQLTFSVRPPADLPANALFAG